MEEGRGWACFVVFSSRGGVLIAWGVLVAWGCPRRMGCPCRVGVSSSRGGVLVAVGVSSSRWGYPRRAGGVLVAQVVRAGVFLVVWGDVAGFGVVSWVGERRDGMEGTYRDDDDDYSSSSAVVAPRRW
jgi:hypothetical protein